MSDMTENKKPEELKDEDLEQVNGGMQIISMKIKDKFKEMMMRIHDRIRKSRK